MSCLFSLLKSGAAPQPFLVFHDLDIFEGYKPIILWTITHLGFCGLSLTWGLSNVSLRLDSGDVFSMGITTEVMRCSFPGIRSGGTLCCFVQLLVMYNIDQLVKDVFTQLIHSKVIIFPFVINRQLVVGLCKHLRSTKLSPLVLASIDNSSDGHQSEILTPTSLPHLLAEIIV